jgi:predicted transcriptional regulator of viral defense system
MALPVDDLLPDAEAVAWAHGPAAISHESALAMRGIGDFNPTRVDLTITPRYFPRRPVRRTPATVARSLARGRCRAWWSSESTAPADD